MDISTVTPRELGEKIVEVLYRKKAKNIAMLNVEEQTSITEFYVIANGNSRTQIRALSDEVDVKLKEAGIPPINVEGRGNVSWIVADFDNVIVHVFSREAREFYNLDKLYNDTTEVKSADNE